MGKAKSSAALVCNNRNASTSESATNCNAHDKIRIEYLQNSIKKMLREPQMIKKAAQFIEEMLSNTTQK